MTQDENEPVDREEREDARADEAYHRRKDDELTGDAPPSIVTRSLLLPPDTVNMEAEASTLYSWWAQGRTEDVAAAIGKYPSFIAAMLTAALCMLLIDGGHGATACARLAVTLERVGKREGGIRA